MQTIVYNIIIAALVLAAFLGLFSEPCDSLPMTQWLVSLVTTKGIAAAAIYAIYRLEKRSK